MRCLAQSGGALLVGGELRSMTVFDIQDEQLSQQGDDDPGRPRRVGRETKVIVLWIIWGRNISPLYIYLLSCLKLYFWTNTDQSLSMW